MGVVNHIRYRIMYLPRDFLSTQEISDSGDSLSKELLLEPSPESADLILQSIRGSRNPQKDLDPGKVAGFFPHEE